MGLVFVLILYAIGLTIAASFAATLMGTVCFFLTRNSERRKRKKAILVSLSFPFAGVVFAGAWFVVYAVINLVVFHRDAGLGDSWETPLPNGYDLMMIDTTNVGIYDPRTQPIKGSVGSRYDTVFDIRQLQIAGRLIFGARDSQYPQHWTQESKQVDTYFEFNTAKKTLIEFKTPGKLQQRAAEQGVVLQLRDIQSVYSEYRFTWFDYSAASVLLLIPLAGFVVLSGWVWKI